MLDTHSGASHDSLRSITTAVLCSKQVPEVYAKLSSMLHAFPGLSGAHEGMERDGDCLRMHVSCCNILFLSHVSSSVLEVTRASLRAWDAGKRESQARGGIGLWRSRCGSLATCGVVSWMRAPPRCGDDTCCSQGFVSAALWSTIAPVSNLHTFCDTSTGVQVAKRACTGKLTAQNVAACTRRRRGRSGLSRSDRAPHAG